MHAFVSTQGIVLAKFPAGESNSVALVLTEDLGLIRAHVRNGRSVVSKLRYSTEPLTQARFSLVRGRYEWKLVGADIAHRSMSAQYERRKVIGRIAQLCTRLMLGSEPNRLLYQDVHTGLEALRACPIEQHKFIEVILVLRVLFHLGYVPELPDVEPFLHGSYSNKEIIDLAQSRYMTLVRTINASLKATGM